jgi:hypothetical protein
MADSLWGLAAAALAEGSLVRSARLLGAEEALRGEGRVPIRLAPAERHDSVRSALRQRMEHATLAASWQEGLSMGQRAQQPMPSRVVRKVPRRRVFSAHIGG